MVNVVGQSYHVVGYWTDKSQKLSRTLSSDATASGQTISDDRLGYVIWPGGSTQVPRGWAIPTISKRLRIAVPVKDGFKEFVTITYDKSRNTSIVTGFCIDVFDAVLRRLDYALPYDLIPYKADKYDDLVYQVYLNKFDAVVGDTTILGKRSKFVDFTQPFTESGLVMVVPIKTDEVNNAWAFMLPFTPGMWCVTGGFFIFTGVVVWLLEHRINPQFRGEPSAQIVTLLWFSFSTLFFAHRERIVSSLGRMVIIIWLFVVLILTSSYTASLTSMLTVQQLKPTVASVESLRTSGAPVGYQDGSFVRNYLQDKLGLGGKNLKNYSTPEGFAEALTEGPNKLGGVAAIFDEIPYIRLFLSQQCGYTMVGPTYRTGGLGFVFPKGSPLVSDISRAVLSLSEDKEMQRIQTMYFNTTLCTNPGAKVDSNRLTMDSFWGLYLITGTASVLALIIFFCRILYNFKRDPNVAAQESSKSKSMKSFGRYLDKKEEVASKRRSETPCSTPNFTSPSPAQGNPFSGSTSDSDESFTFEDHQQQQRQDNSGGVVENGSERSSSVSVHEISANH